MGRGGDHGRGDGGDPLLRTEDGGGSGREGGRGGGTMIWLLLILFGVGLVVYGLEHIVVREPRSLRLHPLNDGCALRWGRPE